jgi:hypothetical protein
MTASTPPGAGRSVRGWSRRRVLIAAAVVAGAVALAIVRPGFNGTAENAGGPSNSAGRAGAEALPDVPVVDLRLERLQAEREELADAERNPFRFRPKPPPPPPPRAAAPVRRPEDFAPPPPPPGPPPVPPIPVKFMGVITTVGGTRVAAFTDGRGGIFSGKEGDIIEGRYRVLRIGADSVEMAYLDGRGRQTIRMTGQ